MARGREMYPNPEWACSFEAKPKIEGLSQERRSDSTSEIHFDIRCERSMSYFGPTKR